MFPEELQYRSMALTTCSWEQRTNAAKDLPKRIYRQHILFLPLFPIPYSIVRKQPIHRLPTHPSRQVCSYRQLSGADPLSSFLSVSGSLSMFRQCQQSFSLSVRQRLPLRFLRHQPIQRWQSLCLAATPCDHRRSAASVHRLSSLSAQSLRTTRISII
jgi:hypothetical protein